MEKIRNSNIEILRIIAMLLIVTSHFGIHSDFQFQGAISFNEIYAQCLNLGGKLGVSIFVLITGYFLIDSKFSLKKLVKLVVNVFTFSIICLCFGVIIHSPIVNIKIAIKSIFPIIFRLYWFATEYVFLYIISPYINKLLNVMSKKETQTLIIILVICSVLIPTFTTAGFVSSMTISMISLYIIGAYIKKYGSKLSNKKNIAVFLFSILFIILSIIVFNYLGTKFSVFKEHSMDFTRIDRLPIPLAAIAIFNIFKDLKIKNSKIINSIAKSMFGVYLIHDNPIIRDFIWKRLINVSGILPSLKFVIFSIVSILFVFITCIVLEKIIDFTVNKLFVRVATKLVEKLKGKVEKKYEGK